MGYPCALMRRLPDLVLASTSRYRRALLERLRIPFEVVAPCWSEVRLVEPDATVLANALGKARSVAQLRPAAAILASDQIAWCAGRTLEKPGTPEAARAQLEWLAGREHSLHTCVVLRMPDGRELQETVAARLHIRALRPEEIDVYVASDLPLDCAGSYRTEALGIVLFDWMRCDDPTAIEGLPLIATRRLLEEAGWRLLETGAAIE